MIQRRFRATSWLLLRQWVAVSCLVAWLQPITTPAAEVDATLAATWWPRLENVYTPIGWKNHLFRFNVYYNGMIMANPQPEPDVKALDPWQGLGMQLTIMPSESGLNPYRWRAGTFQMTTDNGRRWGYQGLLGHPTPVIWTEWKQSFRSAIGYVLRQEVFAHMEGGQEIQTGTEPLYAWVRMSIAEVNPLMNPQPCDILLRINKPHIFPEMYQGRNLALRRTDARYPRPLTLQKTGPADRPGCLLIEPDGKVRLGVLPGRATDVRLESDGEDVNFHVVIPSEKGAFVDILVPMVPESSANVLREIKLGRREALAESDRYWSMVPATAARIETPERYVNELLYRNAQYAEVIAQKMPGTEFRCNLTGSLVYARMWATPTTLFDTMLLDTLGYHDAVHQYLEMFRQAQGQVKPPGPAYERHSGYLAGPPSLAPINWLSDHGALLHAAAYHALVTDDAHFISQWLEPILKACEFIRDARQLTDHDGVQGVIPPAVATDRHIPTQAVWNVGWHYRGLISAVRLLRRLHHPRAGEFAREAESYRAVFIEALRKRTLEMPTWTDLDGTTHHLVPTSVSGGSDWTHPFYLDTGPLFLVYAGLLPADDPLMVSTLKFFREGPNHLAFDPHGHFEQPGVLIHEISSCEPCSSFNLFHSHQLGDREHFLEGMYSMMTGAHSRQTYIACESRGGVTGLVGHIDIYTARLAVIDDLIEEDELHLLRLAPQAWFRENHRTRFENIPTVHGPVDLSFQLMDEGKTLRIDYQSLFHHAPRRVILHTPPVEGLQHVLLNGQGLPVTPGSVMQLEEN